MASRGSRPDYQDVVEAVDRAKALAGSRMQLRVLGESIEGREIPCLVCTDPDVADEQKQRVYVVAGQQGTKESGRAIALALLEFLISEDPDARGIMQHQVIALVPCANPDGAQQDILRNAKNADIAHSYRIDQPSTTPEGWLLERFGLAFAPEVFVDLHGRGQGSMKEYAWLSGVWGFSSDAYFMTIMCAEMNRAAEEAGFPQYELRPPADLVQSAASEDSLGAKLAAEVKSLPFNIEAIEQYYREPQWRASGMARLRRLLRYGQEDAFGLGRPGYPCMLISGARMWGLIAHGTTVAARRQNRVEMTSFLRRNYTRFDRGEDGLERCATVFVSSDTCDGHNPERFSILVRIPKPCVVQSVEWKGQPLQAGQDHGYERWEIPNSVFVKANIQEPFGGTQRFLTVRYDSPLFAKPVQ
jgi:hypothetical protein